MKIKEWNIPKSFVVLSDSPEKAARVCVYKCTGEFLMHTHTQTDTHGLINMQE